MKLTIGKKMGTGFGVLLGLTATLAVVVLINLRSIDRQFSFVIQHDAKVISNARHLLTLVVDMETGQRGFVITGKDEFLAPYEKAISSFEGLMDKEKTLVSDNLPQVKLLEKIEASVALWKEKAAKPEIAMRRKIVKAGADAHQLQVILSQRTGKYLMDSFMTLGHEIEVAFSGREDWEGAFVVEVIEKCMADREDGQRGFLITGKEDFLDKYTNGEQKKLPEYFDRLRNIISDRGRTNELAGKADRLEKLAAEWSHKAAEPEIAIRRKINEHPESLRNVAGLLETGTGKNILDIIRQDFDKFTTEEERLTALRFFKASSASRQTTQTTLVLALASLILGGIMARKITQSITKPIHRLTNALEAVSASDFHQRIEVASEDEIGKLSDSFNEMVNDLKILDEYRVESEEVLRKARQAAETANQSKSEFLASMSHEIRTPMTAILGFNEILLENATDSTDIDAAGTVKKNGEFLLSLINDILDLSKIDAGKIELEKIDCSTQQFLSEVFTLMNERATAKSLPLTVKFDGPIPETICTDPTRLRQVLINIIGNAIKFTECGSVELVARLLDEPGQEPKLQLDVIDSGIGISDDKLVSLFSPFTQADTSTTRKFGGTGLGLSISKKLAERLGGDITVSCLINKGCCFSVTVPTGPLEGVALIHDFTDAETKVAKIEAIHETEISLDNCRILLAEDGLDNQRLISFVLKKAGADITVAGNGQVAFDFATAAKSEGCPFDVILMDMQMPVLDGYGATRKLRESDYQGPIIALTAHAMDSDREKCIDAGCNDYASKPVDRRQLISLISHYVFPVAPVRGGVIIVQ